MDNSGRATRVAIAASVAVFGALLVLAWFYEGAVQHINLLISAVGFVILPLLIWQFGSVRADQVHATAARKMTLNLVMLDVEYLSKTLVELARQTERILGDFDRFDAARKSGRADAEETGEFRLILASTRTLPKFRYEFAFTKKDLQIFSTDDFKMFDLIFGLVNTVNELNENIAALNGNFKSALEETDKNHADGDDLYERYSFINNSYRGAFSDLLSVPRETLPKIDGELLPAALAYAGKNFGGADASYYATVAARTREAIGGWET